MSSTTRRASRLAIASLIASALIAQLAIGLSRSDLTVVRFLSFFTVLSNLAAVVMLTMLALRPRRDLSPGFVAFRGAVTVYMTVTGVIYAVVLANDLTDGGLSEPWVNWVLHVIGPLALILDWAIHRPGAAPRRRTVLYWLVFPAIYLIYLIALGPVVDWYPYPVFDPGESDGYATVALWSGIALAVVLVVGALGQWWAARAVTEAVTK